MKSNRNMEPGVDPGDVSEQTVRVLKEPLWVLCDWSDPPTDEKASSRCGQGKVGQVVR